MTYLSPHVAGATDWMTRQQGVAAWLVLALCVVACVPAGLRWLRVAQREHYLAGSGGRFAVRWWTATPVNSALAVVAIASGVLAVWWPLAGAVTAAVVALGPLGLSLQGRTSALAWTRRLRTLVVAWAALELVVIVIGAVTGLVALLAVVAALAVPLLVDLACLATAPVERRLAGRFVDQATARLARVGPTVVAVTGSYGKTSTKGHIAHLVRGGRSVVATPASFNNRAGLARAINEHLADGTEVFVAEMGTYGPGEIADLCRWCPPRVAVITAIGPVHLERFGTEDRTVEAKAEITELADDVVLQVDDPRLATLAGRLSAAGKRVIRCSAVDRSADVCVLRHASEENDQSSAVTVVVDGEVVAEAVTVPIGVQPGNLACAIGVARVLGITADALRERLGDLPSVEHRLQAVPSPSGFSILDDTYNANPAGAAEALRVLATPRAGAPIEDVTQRAVVVTPGMVELGFRQREENHRLGAAIAGVATDLVVVGRTNRRALLAGVASADRPDQGRRCTVRCVADRDEAVAWVRANLGPGDVVLYENDLPDHYP